MNQIQKKISNNSKIKNKTFKIENNWINNKRNNNSFNLANPYPTCTTKQRDFYNPHPKREYRRFIETKISESGTDPTGKIAEFINKDLIKPMNRPSLYQKYDFKNPNYEHNDIIKTKPNSRNKYALNIMCRAPTYDTLPKMQQFTQYYFPPKYNNKNPENYRAYSLKTDHIGIKVPKIIKRNNESFIKLKQDYCVSSETKYENKWMPYPSKDSINNLSSKNYDIINFLPTMSNELNCQIMNKTLNDRKKGVGEYLDLTKIYRVNINKDYEEKLKKNPKRFYKFTGIFSNMYDASHKNGNIIIPFGNKK